ncbi:hypothetical protein BT96DRAFT_817506 [Gymnopus androsaceus JB14]|uniref:Uncharacterized protein n=1 Tax=Gymnopus androsaceus JB14 TaxID=1447944 RepID=A0A6A4HUV7_9AGAR|nr:hypothetical protein BT96DRAFT_817506 [Gymnopus androsaceus JB14]
MWFNRAFTYLNVDLGPQFAHLVRLWVDLEKNHNWDNPRRGLSHLNRPVMLNDWISNQRAGAISALSTGPLVQRFAKELWTWWCSLQPKWRCMTSDNRPGPLLTFGSDWKPLHKWGNNGWLGIITCLKWWREGLNSLSDKDRLQLEADWFCAVSDVSKMLQGLLEWYSKAS